MRVSKAVRPSPAVYTLIKTSERTNFVVDGSVDQGCRDTLFRGSGVVDQGYRMDILAVRPRDRNLPRLLKGMVEGLDERVDFVGEAL